VCRYGQSTFTEPTRLQKQMMQEQDLKAYASSTLVLVLEQESNKK
jgi:hypothetical protein